MRTIQLLISAIFIIYSFNATATNVICKSTINCDHDSGICDTPSGWQLDTGRAAEDFLDTNPIGLSSIIGYKESTSLSDPHPYSIRCYYSYGNNSVISTYTYVHELTGINWVFSGFGKNKAECQNIIDPSTCIGKGWSNEN